MTYQETLKWMFSRLPMYQNQGKSAYKANLDNIINLDNYLGHPHLSFKSVHVGGTNGKGSTSHMLASVLQEAGYKVGLYTSPHLKDYRERIKINGEEIEESYVVDFINSHKTFFEEHKLSFFEMTVGMAFRYFSDQKVDIAIIEVGLGGRLDATNIITPILSLITNIGMDHTEFLGDSLEKIAVEKAGIIKPHVPVVIGETQVETKNVFIDKASQTKSNIYFADQIWNSEINCQLKGSYQRKNTKTARVALDRIREMGYNITDKHIETGFNKVIENTGLRGRWQVISKNPLAICDTAHNKEGLQLVINQLMSLDFDKLHIVFGAVKDKDLNAIIPILPANATYYFCKPNVMRGLDLDELKNKFLAFNIRGQVYSSVKQAFDTAKEQASTNDLIFIGGSTFVVAEII
jgi:dihydrofolate synthase / folylpolyglutamate synthase